MAIDSVFISYSRADRVWLDLLKTHLKPFVRNRRLTIFDDTCIRDGANWRDEIMKALRSAAVAVLLVSPKFLESDFIAENELPTLIDRAGRSEMPIFWIPIRHSGYKQSPIEAYQAACDPTRPLDTLPKPQRHRMMVSICERIARVNGQRGYSPAEHIESKDSMAGPGDPGGEVHAAGRTIPKRDLPTYDFYHGFAALISGTQSIRTLDLLALSSDRYVRQVNDHPNLFIEKVRVILPSRKALSDFYAGDGRAVVMTCPPKIVPCGVLG